MPDRYKQASAPACHRHTTGTRLAGVWHLIASARTRAQVVPGSVPVWCSSIRHRPDVDLERPGRLADRSSFREAPPDEGRPGPCPRKNPALGGAFSVLAAVPATKAGGAPDGSSFPLKPCAVKPLRAAENRSGHPADSRLGDLAQRRQGLARVAGVRSRLMATAVPTRPDWRPTTGRHGARCAVNGGGGGEAEGSVGRNLALGMIREFHDTALGR